MIDRRSFVKGSTTAGLAVVAMGMAGCGDDGGGIADGGTDLGPLDEVARSVADGAGVHHRASDGIYVVSVPAEHRAAMATAWGPMVAPSIDVGLLVLSERCPHQGCRVSACEGSGFRCPCHGSQFSPMGEYRDGPAGSGLRAHAVSVEGGRLRVLPEIVDGLDREVDVSGDPGPDGC